MAVIRMRLTHADPTCRNGVVGHRDRVENGLQRRPDGFTSQRVSFAVAFVVRRSVVFTCLIERASESG